MSTHLRLPGIYPSLSGSVCLSRHSLIPKSSQKLISLDGGGYGLFGAVYDPSQLINTNDNDFIAVVIQYRLGAFGFLSSEDVKREGRLNAGLLDQRFALRWVQAHIRRFGGDPNKVTIAGESAGAGAVMLQAMAYGGKQNPSLFNNVRIHPAKKRFPSNTSQDHRGERVCGKAVQV